MLTLFDALEHVGSHIEQFSNVHCALKHDLLTKISETGWNFGSNLEDYKRKILQAMEMTLGSRCKVLLSKLESQNGESAAVITSLRPVVDDLRHDSECAFSDQDTKCQTLSFNFAGLEGRLDVLWRNLELKDKGFNSLSSKVEELHSRLQRHESRRAQPPNQDIEILGRLVLSEFAQRQAEKKLASVQAELEGLKQSAAVHEKDLNLLCEKVSSICSGTSTGGPNRPKTAQPEEPLTIVPSANLPIVETSAPICDAASPLGSPSEGNHLAALKGDIRDFATLLESKHPKELAALKDDLQNQISAFSCKIDLLEREIKKRTTAERKARQSSKGPGLMKELSKLVKEIT